MSDDPRDGKPDTADLVEMSDRELAAVQAAEHEETIEEPVDELDDIEDDTSDEATRERVKDR
jgi:hypothetical protein